MIKLTPAESIYFKEAMAGKTIKEIAQKFEKKENTVRVMLFKAIRKFKMKRKEVIEKYNAGLLEVEFCKSKIKPVKIPRLQTGREEQIRLLRKFGFTEKEILKELRDK